MLGKPGLFALMTRVDRHYRSAVARHLSPIHLTAREYELLRHLREGESSSPSQLARTCGVTRQFAHRLLNRLQQNGFIERWERDRGRGSDVAVALTDRHRLARRTERRRWPTRRWR
ncbi:MAG: MarR family transcriptional regulator [Myxococcaceae bacterium]|nr:MarR family transcriptional regulator [Myxococcaceae bacterium]